MKTVGDVLSCCQALRAKYPKFQRQICIKIDDTGLGGGVTDRLMEIKEQNPNLYRWMRIIPTVFGKKIGHNYYDDTTTYMMSVVKSLIGGDSSTKLGKCELQLPNNPDFVAQISSRKYFFTDQGKMKVESKKAMKERDLPSPDEADSILLACLPVSRREEVI